MNWITEAEKQTLIAGIMPVRVARPPKEDLAAEFEDEDMATLIDGGWGYSQQDAVVFLRSPGGRRYPYVSFEYEFVGKRIYRELIVYRPRGKTFSGIGWNLNLQSLREIDGRKFDQLLFTVTAFPSEYWYRLKDEWEASDAGRKPGFDLDDHNRRRAAARVTLKREFWFDVTDVISA